MTATSPTRQRGKLVPVDRRNRLIAEQMTAAKLAAPHFYVQRSVQARALLDLRSQLPAGSRPTINDLVVGAVARAACAEQRCRTSWTSEGLFVHESVDVSIAMNTEHGLTMPTIRGAQAMSAHQISSETARLKAGAVARKLTPDDYLGGCIGVSNLGMFGVDLVFPIIGVGLSMMLGVGAIKNQLALTRDKGVVEEPVLILALSCDHRVLHGVQAAQFLARVAAHLEAPGPLLEPPRTSD